MKRLRTGCKSPSTKKLQVAVMIYLNKKTAFLSKNKRTAMRTRLGVQPQASQIILHKNKSSHHRS